MQAESKFIKRSFLILFLLFGTGISHQTIFAESIVYFSPDDRPQKHLISYINNAKKRIYAAVYMFTDKKTAMSLIEAKNRGVDVQVVTDQSSVDSPYGKIFLLKNNDIKIYVFKVSTPQYQRFAPLMHNKFAIIDDKLWTGSFNWTVSANSKNQENVIYTDEKKVCERYLTHFKKLKGRCVIKPILKKFETRKPNFNPAQKKFETRKSNFKKRRKRR